MEIGLCLPQLGGHVSRNSLRAFCERAEELGYGSLWVQEHIFYPLHPVSGYSARPGLKVPDAYRSTLGALATLTAAAAWTCRPVLGTSILVAGLHRPVARSAASVAPVPQPSSRTRSIRSGKSPNTSVRAMPK